VPVDPEREDLLQLDAKLVRLRSAATAASKSAPLAWRYDHRSSSAALKSSKTLAAAAPSILAAGG
jgi:hypothetical protein